MKLTMGADPEFLIIKKDGYYVPATQTKFNSSRTTAEIGCDGCGTPLEIRPKPFPYSRIDLFFKEIEKLLSKAGKYFANTKIIRGISTELMGLKGGSYPFGQALGGHMHFGFDANKHRVDRIIKKLDDYIAPILLLLSNKDDFLGRVNNTSYGRLGQEKNGMEYKNYGFEYRTPYTFLTTREMTKGIFTLAGLIVMKYDELPHLHVYQDYLRKYRACDKKAFFHLYKTKIKPNLYRVLKKALSKHRDYQLRIFSVFNHIETNNILKMGNVLHNYFPKKFTKFGSPIWNNLFFSDEEIIPKLRMDMMRQSRCSSYVYRNANIDESIYIYGTKNTKPSGKELVISTPLLGHILLCLKKAKKSSIKHVSGLARSEFKYIIGRKGASWNYKFAIGISRSFRRYWYDGGFDLPRYISILINFINQKVEI